MDEYELRILAEEHYSNGPPCPCVMIPDLTEGGELKDGSLLIEREGNETFVPAQSKTDKTETILAIGGPLHNRILRMNKATLYLEIPVHTDRAPKQYPKYMWFVCKYEKKMLRSGRVILRFKEGYFNEKR